MSEFTRIELLFDQLNACFYSMCQRFDAYDITDWTAFDYSTQIVYLNNLQKISTELLDQLKSDQKMVELPYR